MNSASKQKSAQTEAKGRLRQVGSALVILGAICFFVYRFLRVPDFVQDTKSLNAAFVEGDSDSFYDRMFEQEKQKNNLSREDVRAIWRELIQPRLAGAKVEGRIEVEATADNHQAFPRLVLVSEKGAKFETGLTGNWTPDGGRALLSVALQEAWKYEYLIKRNLPVTTENWYRAAIEGYEKDKSVLKRYGFLWLLNNVYDSPAGSWEGMVERARSELEKAKSPGM